MLGTHLIELEFELKQTLSALSSINAVLTNSKSPLVILCFMLDKVYKSYV